MINVTIRPWIEKKRPPSKKPRKKAKPIWEADITVAFPDGRPPLRRRKASPYKTEKQSEAWGIRFGMELAKKGRPQKNQLADPPVQKNVVLFKELYARYMEEWVEGQERTSGTKQVYARSIEKYLLPKLGEMPLDLITTDHVSQIRAALKTKENGAPRSATHRNYLMNLLQHMLGKAKKWKLLDVVPEMPERLVAASPEIEIFSDDELTRLLDAATGDPVAQLIILLGVDAGLRVGEMLGLRWSDLDLVARRMVVRQQVTVEEKVTATKGKVSRPIPLTPRLAAALKAASHLAERVLWLGAAPLTRSQLTRKLESLEKRAKLIGMKSPHKLRHTFASRCLARGVELTALQALLGHKSLKTTLVYLHLQTGGIERAIGLLAGDQPETKDREDAQ